jgi:charged multivesicular body protein 4A/B
MEQEALTTKMLGTGPLPVAGEVDRLPAVGNGKLSSGKVTQEEEDEEAELRKLQAEMAM